MQLQTNKKRGREAKIKLDTLTRGNGENTKDRHVHAWAILASLIKIVKKTSDRFHISTPTLYQITQLMIERKYIWLSSFNPAINFFWPL